MRSVRVGARRGASLCPERLRVGRAAPVAPTAQRTPSPAPSPTVTAPPTAAAPTPGQTRALGRLLFACNWRNLAATESDDIYTVNEDSSGLTNLTQRPAVYENPTWSPDGMRIAFVSRIENKFDIYIFNLKSNEITKLTENAGRNENPSWSPDGRHLVFSSNRSGKYQLYLVDYDGRNVRQITANGENKMPKWQRLVK